MLFGKGTLYSLIAAIFVAYCLVSSVKTNLT